MTPPAQRCEVGDGRGMLEHLSVHRRAKHHRGAGREINAREQIGCEAMSELREYVGGGWRDEQQVGSISELDMSGHPALALIPKIRGDRAARKHLQGHGRDELRGATRHDDLDVSPELGQRGGKVGSLVGGDGPGDPEDDAFTGELGHATTMLKGVGPGREAGKGVLLA